MGVYRSSISNVVRHSTHRDLPGIGHSVRTGILELDELDPAAEDPPAAGCACVAITEDCTGPTGPTDLCNPLKQKRGGWVVGWLVKEWRLIELWER